MPWIVFSAGTHQALVTMPSHHSTLGVPGASQLRVQVKVYTHGKFRGGEKLLYQAKGDQETLPGGGRWKAAQAPFITPKVVKKQAQATSPRLAAEQ